MLLPMISLPFIASLTAGLIGRSIGIKGTNIIVVGSLIISTILSLIIGYEVVLSGSSVSLKLGTWFDTGLINIDWGFIIDPLGAWLTSTVLVISTLVHIFATSYMAGDPAPQRFMSLLVGFTAFMVILVTGDSLGTLFLGWEGIGITSFLLIGYWWDRSAACNAAGQALITNRVGDASFTIALLLLICSTKSLDLNTVTMCFYNLGSGSLTSPITTLEGFESTLLSEESVNHVSTTLNTVFGINTLNWVGVLLVIAAFGKSAQFILHTWLPQAMEGPTPVSALLHAATLVAGGIYLLIRCSAIVGASTWALIIATIFGTITAIFAGTTALLQNDAKRIIAYSTCSQFGYLTASVGVGQTGSTLFHLSSHAGFKALLFVCAGGVLHSMSDEQDIRRLGGLIYTLPFTYTALLVGSLSLIATPYLSGFYSKDLILELAASQLTISGTWFWIIGSLVAGITGCYSIKLLAYVFLGSPEASKRSYEQAHEQSTGIIVPIIILSLLALTFGYFAKESIIGFGTDVTPIVLSNIGAATFVGAEFGLKGVAKLLPLFLTLSGVILGIIIFVYKPSLFVRLARRFNILGYSLSNKWWADMIIARQIVWPIFNLGLFSSKVVDKGLLEIIGPWGFTLSLYPNSPKKIWSISSFTLIPHKLPSIESSIAENHLADPQYNRGDKATKVSLKDKALDIKDYSRYSRVVTGTEEPSNIWMGNILPAYSSYIVLFALLAVFSTGVLTNIIGGETGLSLSTTSIWSIAIISLSRSLPES